LNKKYHKYPFGIKSNDDLHTVKDIYLEVEDCELLTILGHKGAGRTTLIGVLTRILELTSSKAEICNYDSRENMDEIRQIMGVCLRNDILWDELTAQEYLIMFTRMKRMKRSQKARF